MFVCLYRSRLWIELAAFILLNVHLNLYVLNYFNKNNTSGSIKSYRQLAIDSSLSFFVYNKVFKMFTCLLKGSMNEVWKNISPTFL